MARTLLRVPITDGSSEFIEVEVDTRDLGEAVQLNSAGRDIGTATFSLASAVDRMLPALSTIVARLRSATHAPDEIGMELGLKVGGETGLILAKGTSEASLTIRATWIKPKPADDPPADQPAAG